MNTVTASINTELNRLVEKAQGGDKAAFTELVAKMTNTVSAIALAVTQDVQDSRDVSQLVFIKIWQQLSQLKNRDSVLPWVRQITRNTAINFIRDSKKSRYKEVGEQQLEARLSRVCEVKDHDLSLIEQEQTQLIQHLLEQLPAESREVVVLYYREEQNSQAVAQLLGITEANVRKRLQRIRALLKDRILHQYGKVLLTSAPIGLTTTFALTAMSSAPAAASTIALSVSSNGGWLGKTFGFLGGAGLGGLMGVFSNNLMMRYVMRHIDNGADLALLDTLRRQSNIWMLVSCVLLWLSYQFSQGWLLPVLSYALFLAGLTAFVRARNKISFTNLLRQAQDNPSSYRNISRTKKANALGWLLGASCGSAGLFYGLWQSGRFELLI